MTSVCLFRKRSLSPHGNTRPDVTAAYAELKDAQVDFIIGGITSIASNVLRNVAVDDDIRVLLLEPPESPLPDHFFQVGVPDEQLYQKVVSQWTTDLNIENVMVIYDKSDAESYRYGKDISSKVLQDDGRKIIKVPFSSRNEPKYDRQIDQAIKHQPDGVIVSALPWESASIIRQIGANTEVPILLATPSGWSHQFWTFALEDNAQVYYGAQYWLINYEDSLEFARRLREHSGWSKAEITSQSVQAYDAVKIADKIWNTMRANQTEIEDLTSIGPFDGISGELQFMDSQIVASDIRLIHVNSPDHPAACPSC